MIVPIRVPSPHPIMRVSQQSQTQDPLSHSVVILLSDYRPDGSDGGGGNATHQQTGNVTHPFVTQTYRCVDAYETKDTKNRPFTVAVNEKLDVLIKDPAGQWLWLLCS